MKLHILSDLHLGFAPFDPPANDADVVILAGDVARPREAAAWALRLRKPVLYVLGNHEFYGSSIDAATAELEHLCAGTPVHVLDNRELVIGRVRFLGTTLWTDFRLLGEGAAQATALAEARRLLRDYSAIRAREASSALFTPEDSMALFGRNAAWLASRLAQPHAGPTVVITHHAPSPRSIHARFAGSLINTCFASDLEPLVKASRAPLWVHGHTHDSFDYAIGATRIVCNPRGYSRGGMIENARFDPGLIVDVD